MAVEPTELNPDTDRFLRLCAEFEALVEQDPAARARRLEELAALDTTMADELRGMLQAHERPELKPAAANAAAPLPSTLGGYRVLREIGRGGMGRVLLAERADGRFTRQVAIKVLDHSGQDAEFLRRFKAEREILARLKHPNIVRLLDAGEDDDGTPYLVMEFVDGRPLDEYLAQHALSLAQRVALFEQVAGALAHAHRMLVAHRDLKPGNILVDAQGQAHLLDFGIARLLDQSRLTATAQRALTPRYAAPEQIEGAPTSTATDIYQLGNLLYELMCGEPPFAEPNGSALLRAILEGGIAPPSQRALRATRSDARLIDADLDAICLYALRRESELRYPSVESMLADLARWRRGEPVLARKGGHVYRFRKLLRRHWRSVGMLVLVSVLTVAFVWRLRAELDRSEQQRAIAEQATELMVDVFGRADPARAQGQELTLREAMDQSVERLGEANDLPDTVRARVLEAVGSTYVELSEAERAVSVLGEAAAGYARAGDRESTFRSLHAQAVAMQDLGQYDEARAQLEQVLRDRLQMGTRGDSFEAELHSTIGILFQYQRQPHLALEAFERALAVLRSMPHPDREQMAHTLRNLGDIRTAQGDVEGGIAALQEANTLVQSLYGEEHPERIRMLRMLGRNALKRGALDEAVAYFESGWAAAQKTFTAPHGVRVQLAHPLALTRLLKGRIDEAAFLMSQALVEAEQLFPPGHPSRATLANDLALILLGTPDLNRARQLAEVAADARKDGPNATALAESQLILAVLSCRRGERRNLQEVDDLSTWVAQISADPMTTPMVVEQYRRAAALCAPASTGH